MAEEAAPGEAQTPPEEAGTPPGAEAAPPAVITLQELAKGLPGLPLNHHRFRLGHEGLERGERLVVSWEWVTSVTADGKRITFEGTKGEGRARRLLRLRVGAIAARAVESVWTELCFRKVQRDGKLAGGVSYWRLRSRVVVRFLASALVIFLAIYTCQLAWTRGRAGGSEGKDDDTRAGIINGRWAVPAFLAYAGLGGVAWAVMTRRRTARFKTRWGRWELRDDGLFLRPEGGEGGEGADEERVELSEGMTLTPVAMRSKAETVPFDDLTGRPVLARLVLASAECEGARLRAVSVRAMLRELSLVFVALVPASGLIAALTFGLRAGVTWLIVLAAAVLVGGACRWILKYVRMQKVLTRLLEDGRAKLKHLGWRAPDTPDATG